MNFVVICLSQSSLVLIADYSLVLSSLQFCPQYKNCSCTAKYEALIVLALQSKLAHSKHESKLSYLERTLSNYIKEKAV